jgi:hypothetical protein
MDGLAALEAELKGSVPAGFSRLSAAELDDLATAVREARRRQAAEVASVGERALSLVPRFLRGPVRKLVG